MILLVKVPEEVPSVVWLPVAIGPVAVAQHTPLAVTLPPAVVDDDSAAGGGCGGNAAGRPGGDGDIAIVHNRRNPEPGAALAPVDLLAGQ